MGKSHSKSLSKSSSSKRVVESNQISEVDAAVKHMLTAEEEVEDSSLRSEIQCKISLKGLPGPYKFFVVAYERFGSDDWCAIGNTETSQTTSSPEFLKHVLTRYSFETPQRMRLDLYKSGSGKDMKPVVRGEAIEIPPDSELLDSVECHIAEAVVGQDGYLQRPICSTATLGLFVQEVRGSSTMVRFEVSLDELDLSSLKSRKSHQIYCTVNRFSSDEVPVDDVRTLVARTETLECAVDKTGQVKEKSWAGLHLSVMSMCRGDANVPISVRLVDSGPKGDELLGSCEFSYKELEDAARGAGELQLAVKGNAGKLTLQTIQIERNDSFLDYVAGGMSINLFIAIDFTKSNREPNQEGSLHSFADPAKPNDYVRVIQSVVDILQFYDNDKRIPVYGFGARLPPAYNHTSHCFACSGDFFDPEVVGIDEILRVYQQALNSVVLHGPTNFHELVRLVADFSEPYADPHIGTQKYSVLLILTDGVITDMKQTINEVVRAAEFPMSIVVVGVGDEDFGLMQILDGDDQRLYSTDERRFATRDIVQFVKFNDFKEKPLHVLATETLAEIPREVVNFFKSRNIGPGSRVPTDVCSESTQKDEEIPKSDIAKQLDVLKGQFLEEVTKIATDVDEFEVYKILTEEKVPSRDIGYFQEIISKAPRGVNVFSIPKPANVDALDSRSKRISGSGSRHPNASARATIQQAKSTVAETVTNAPVVDLSGAKDINDAELVSVGKPLAASFGSALPEAKAQIAKTFSVEHLTPPRSPTMHQLPDVPENTRPVSPSVMVNLDLTKPLPAYTRGESKMSTLSRAESKPPVVAQALPDATSAPAVAEAPASEENP